MTLLGLDGFFLLKTKRKSLKLSSIGTRKLEIFSINPLNIFVQITVQNFLIIDLKNFVIEMVLFMSSLLQGPLNKTEGSKGYTVLLYPTQEQCSRTPNLIMSFGRTLYELRTTSITDSPIKEIIIKSPLNFSLVKRSITGTFVCLAVECSSLYLNNLEKS
eukprot:jgi/Orpsp1_1/1185946/evm.model.c7180000096154.1